MSIARVEMQDPNRTFSRWEDNKWAVSIGSSRAEMGWQSMGCGTSLSVSSSTGRNGVGLDHLPAQPQARSAFKGRAAAGAEEWPAERGSCLNLLRMSVASSPWKEDLKQGRLEVLTPFSEELGKHGQDFIWKADHFPVALAAFLS